VRTPIIFFPKILLHRLLIYFTFGTREKIFGGVPPVDLVREGGARRQEKSKMEGTRGLGEPKEGRRRKNGERRIPQATN
jgi:hypothetical protein